MTTPTPRRSLKLVLPALALMAAQPALADDHVVIGPGVAVVPGYEGSGSYRVLPIPLVDVKHGRLFVNPVDGAGVNVIDTAAFDLGAAINYVVGYRGKDAPAGVGKLSDAAGARMFAVYHHGGVHFEFGGTRSLGGTKGTTADATLSYTAKIAPAFTLSPSVSSTWANARYDRRYFGITPDQSAQSGLAAYSPGSGFKDVTTGITAKYVLKRRWIVALTAGERGLLGEAADSPIVRHAWQPVGSFGVAYAF